MTQMDIPLAREISKFSLRTQIQTQAPKMGNVLVERTTAPAIWKHKVIKAPPLADNSSAFRVPAEVCGNQQKRKAWVSEVELLEYTVQHGHGRQRRTFDTFSITGGDTHHRMIDR